MCDKLIFDLSQETESVVSPFVKKDWISILDNMSGQYGSNQILLDTSQLSNSNKYMSYREAYLAVPMLLTVATTTLATAAGFVPATAATSADYAVGLKSWFGNIIHSLQVEYNGVTIIQQTPFANMWNSFKLLTSLSWEDVATQGASIGFYPDDPLSFCLEAAVNPNGIGVCNNTNRSSQPLGAIVTGAFNSYSSQNGNIGFLKRQQYINYDPAADSGSGTYGADLLSAAGCNTLWKSYVLTKVNGVNAGNQGVFQISIMAQIKLKHLHNFFDRVPLLKGAYLKFVMALNNTTTDFTSPAAGGNLTLNSVSNSVGGVNPLMIASASPNQGAVAAFGASTYRANISVGQTCLDNTLRATAGVAQGSFGTSVQLYIPAYTFAPVFESAYLSSPIKTVNYSDIYFYQINGVAANGGLVNQLLTNGLAGVRSVTVLPFFAASSNNIIGAAASPLPTYQSPYDPAGTGCTSPLALLSQFQIVVSGQNALYNQQRYSFEAFSNNLYGANSVNGGCTDGLTSGLISQLGFEMEYCYHYVDVSRMLEVEKSVPKSIQVVGQNTSVKALDLFCFVEYDTRIAFDILTGSRV
jgi:hypothetical protein